ncbi:extracellular solute-binding protein [Mesorhizobium sp. M1E.F.Ca.ET.045.02.1.1]|uniref:ABC transporter substrate-binding protein n=1 Tax=Mesorhizobium sp. M1E.F.Ca.ET.045.02.1.1 TaxID=2493672 RepID=UPI000F75B60B|nr:extracellular solute-binding protein [Mesorhizobium sp. M1E.F.Ca.ET.045.02.1.1]AZO22621.1 extracellular solute-binding protein [Mesorhizobium sp. M1E.F.Ca.ET.045.02.1.1]
MSNNNIFDRPLRRRTFLTGSALATAAMALPAPWVGKASAQQFAGKEIRVLTWSDATGQAAVKNILKTFEAKTGAKVIADLTGTTSDMIAKIKASASKPQYDVVILSGFGANSLADAGLLEKPDTSAVPNLARVLPDYQTGAKGHGIGYFLWSDGLVYNTKTYPSAPKSYDVLWDAANEGKIFLPPPDNLYALELIIVAAKAAGGDIHNPDGGFEILKKLKGKSLTITSNANQIGDLFRSQSLNAGGVYSPLELSPFISKPEFNVSGTYSLAEGFFVDLQYMVVPKGHPGDTAVVAALMNHALDGEVQGKMAEDVWYGPINQDAVLSEGAKKSPFIPSPEVIKEHVNKVDPAYLASVRDDWIQRYTDAVM